MSVRVDHPFPFRLPPGMFLTLSGFSVGNTGLWMVTMVQKDATKVRAMRGMEFALGLSGQACRIVTITNLYVFLVNVHILD